MASEREPTWRLVLLGWLWGQGLLAAGAGAGGLVASGSAPEPVPEPLVRASTPAGRDPGLPFPFGPPGQRARFGRGECLDPLGASARAMRAWPGIGEARALAVARARWEHGSNRAELYLEDVPGIGPATAEGVRDWLDAAGLDGAPSEVRGL